MDIKTSMDGTGMAFILDAGQGFNVISKKYVDMIEDGIIDPTEVVVNEIQNAASVGGLLLTTDCLIVEEDKDNANCQCTSQPGMM